MTDNNSPDAIYWRRMRRGEPEVTYIRQENLHFWPGEGPCLDGFYYWLKKGDTLADPQGIVKRVTLATWRSWGRRKHAPPEEKPWPDAFQERLERDHTKPTQPQKREP